MATPIEKAIAFAWHHRELQQFGQTNDSWVWDGKTACTHTVCQFLALLWTGKYYTLNEVNALAGMPKNAKNLKTGLPRGMRTAELARFFEAAKIPMVIKYDLTPGQLLYYSKRAPVFYAMRYGSAPSWKGYRYQGINAQPPYAIRNGRTQLNAGANEIRHAVVLLGYRTIRQDGKVIRVSVYRKEPNHGSPIRPEKPPFDTITRPQFEREYKDYHDRLGQRLTAAIPTRSLP